MQLRAAELCNIRFREAQSLLRGKDEADRINGINWI
jgi:hypothetical protein